MAGYTVPTQATWLATGNNLLVRGDLSTRVLICTIDPHVEKPEERRFKRNLYEWIPKNRAKLVRAALAMMRGWYVAGCPKSDVAPFGRFETWEPVRHCLLWLGMPDPCLSRAAVESADPVRDVLRELLHAWYARFSWQEITTRRLIEASDDDVDLRELLMEVAADRNNRGTVSARRLGRYLARYNRRIEDGLRLESAGPDSRTKVSRWRVVGVSGSDGVSPHGVGSAKKDNQVGDISFFRVSSGLGNTPHNTETPHRYKEVDL
jgi:putative DNA primase/helicase